MDTAAACREHGIKTVAVTAGYICDEPRRDFFNYIDAANIDLKAFSEKFYWKITGAHLQPVLETLLYLKQETRVWFELTTLLIPGENDSEAELQAMTQWVVENLGVEVPMHFTAFHPDWKMRDTPATPLETLTLARTIALKNGVRYAYTGNVIDKTGSSTWCHGCGGLLIGRQQYTLSEWNLDSNGNCRHCGSRCSGVFDDARRLGGTPLAGQTDRYGAVSLTQAETVKAELVPVAQTAVVPVAPMVALVADLRRADCGPAYPREYQKDPPGAPAYRPFFPVASCPPSRYVPLRFSCGAHRPAGAVLHAGLQPQLSAPAGPA